MEIIVLGAGAIGSLVGALLSKGNNVVLIGKEEHVNKIKKSGLEISGCIKDNFQVKSKTKISSIDDNALIILTTKAFDNEESLKEIKHLIKENTIILCLQNGLGNEESIKKIVNCRVIRGVTTSGASLIGPGKVKCSNIGDIYLEDSKVSGNISGVLSQAGLKTEIISDIQAMIWKKLIVNCAINPLTAILKVKNGDLLRFQDLIRLIIGELVMVAEKEGFSFDEKETFNMVIQVIEDSANNCSSMLQDILKGKRTEIDYLNYAAVKIGKKHSIKCPINEGLSMLIKGMEGK
ncbi:2-dehydropantoate 2-reductase [Candidatus Woesearchaeota archaeon]|nr:2-dehydropantoate 2-reductase [Candidatus Woesearchaeota archaeon]